MKELDKLTLVLAGLLVFFTIALFLCERVFYTDGQMFQVVAGLLTTTSGVFFKDVAGKFIDKGDNEKK